MPLCLVTGANGFVGQALCQHLLTHHVTVRGTLRTPQAGNLTSAEFSTYLTGDIDSTTNWQPALQQVDYVIHLAGTVHRPDIQDPSVYQRSITAATRRLAEQAIAAGVKRFIYISSAHVYGVEASTQPIAENHPCHPLTPYAQAKYQAEHWLIQQMRQSAMEIVIVRLPLVYGPGVRGNFAQLVKLVKLLPCLPLGLATQSRSLVGLDNLVNFLCHCLEHPQAAQGVFNVSDDQDLSTRAIGERLAHAMHKSRFFLPIPARLMQLGLQLCGKQAMYNKLFSAMQLDIGRAKQQLQWRAPFSVEQQLLKTLAKS